MEEDVKTIHDYLDILKRRKWALILPVCIVFLIAFLVALAIPPTYRSTTTILIEEQEIPLDFVRTTITGFAEQRLQQLNQRVMSSTKLLEIINRFNLYDDLKKKLSIEEILDIMRKDIKLTTISADVVEFAKRSSTPSPITIAFTLSYDGKNPQVVQQVAGVLSSLFLEENLKVREERAQGASKFLGDEAANIQKTLAEIDAKIARYKEKHVNELPELLQVNLSSIDRIERDIDMLKQQLSTLKERESYYRSQLASIPTNAANQDRMLLNELKAKLVQLQSKFSDKHPDVKKTMTEIAELEKRLEAVPSAVGKKGGSGTTFSPLDQPDNPAYVNLASQLVSVQSEVETVRRQIDEMSKKRDGYYRRMEASPRVEESYKALLSERNNTQLKYDDLMKKSMEANVAQGLEKEKMGERFTIIDPARLPEKPIKPNVPAILLIGLFLGIGAGVGTASLREFNDQSVRNPNTLTTITHLPVLVAIPEIIIEKDILARKRTLKKLLIAAVVVCIVGLALFHFFVMDLDVLWARFARKFM